MLDLYHPYSFIQEVGVGSAAAGKLISTAYEKKFMSPVYSGNFENYLIN